MKKASLSPRLLASAAFLILAPLAHAQLTAYGVTAGGLLFRFDVNAPAVTTLVGGVGFVPEGIDFRPSTNQLYAIDIGPTTTQLYTLNISTGAATPVGTGFASSGSVGGNAYDLTTSATFGFDFNPTTLQLDGSMRIRLIVGTDNLRLNSDTGQIAAVDTDLAYASGDPNFGATPRVDAAAYINNIASIGGTTRLFDLDVLANVLAEQTPANSGQLSTIGSAGLAGTFQLNAASFDIYTDPSSTDPTIGGDTGFAVVKRAGVASGAFQLYNVNLSTGALSNPQTVGGGSDFTGGFAIVPEPSSICLLLLGCGALAAKRLRHA